MTIKELRITLESIPEKYDHLKLATWLPGSYIDLGTNLILKADSGKPLEFLVEGNLRPGSALE